MLEKWPRPLQGLGKSHCLVMLGTSDRWRAQLCHRLRFIDSSPWRSEAEGPATPCFAGERNWALAVDRLPGSMSAGLAAHPGPEASESKTSHAWLTLQTPVTQMPP